MDLCGESFSGLRLEGEAISSGVVEDCLFTRCRFSNLEVKNLRVTGCRFVECSFSVLRPENLTCLDNTFEGCAISGIEWAALLDPRKRDMGFLPFGALSQCTLHYNVFFALDLGKFDFHGCDLTGSSFDECNLKGADFSGCVLKGVGFSHNDLREADFRGAGGYAFSPENNQVKGARFSLPEAVGLLAALGIVLEEG